MSRPLDLARGCRRPRPASRSRSTSSALARAGPALGRPRLPAATRSSMRAAAVPYRDFGFEYPPAALPPPAPAGVHELELRDLVRGAHGRLRRRLHRGSSRPRCGAVGAGRGAHLGGAARVRGLAARARLALRHALRPVADAARARRRWRRSSTERPLLAGRCSGSASPRSSGRRCSSRSRSRTSGGGEAEERASSHVAAFAGVAVACFLPFAILAPHGLRVDVRRPARPAAAGGEPRRGRADGGRSTSGCARSRPSTRTARRR